MHYHLHQQLKQIYYYNNQYLHFKVVIMILFHLLLVILQLNIICLHHLRKKYFNDTTYTYNDLKDTLTNGKALYFPQTGNEVITNKILSYHSITQESTGVWSSYSDVLADIYTYWLFICPTINVIKNVKSNIRNNVYLYQFDIADPIMNQFLSAPDCPKCWTRACHAADLNYVFLQPVLIDGMEGINNKSVEVGEQLQIFWTNYAKSLDPNQPIGSNDIWSNIGNDNNYINFIDFTGNGWTDNWIKTETSIDTNIQNICNFYDLVGYSGVYPTLSPTKSPTQTDSTQTTTQIATQIATLTQTVEVGSASIKSYVFSSVFVFITACLIFPTL
eukprot:998103_1